MQEMNIEEVETELSAEGLVVPHCHHHVTTNAIAWT